MRYVILHNAVQQGPKFTTREEAMNYARQNGFTNETDAEKGNTHKQELSHGYTIVEVSKWKQD